jgi:hypothetical protein
MFKRLFGSEENKDVLIGFLNILMHDAAIVDVDFIPTEHHGMTEHDRKAVFDISCKCADGQTFIIEMQKGYQKHFRKRAVFYTSYPINEQWRLAREKFIREHEATDDGEVRISGTRALQEVPLGAGKQFRQMDVPAETHA